MIDICCSQHSPNPLVMSTAHPPDYEQMMTNSNMIDHQRAFEDCRSKWHSTGHVPTLSSTGNTFSLFSRKKDPFWNQSTCIFQPIGLHCQLPLREISFKIPFVPNTHPSTFKTSTTIAAFNPPMPHLRSWTHLLLPMPQPHLRHTIWGTISHESIRSLPRERIIRLPLETSPTLSR